MAFKNFGPFGLLALSFVVLLSQGTLSEAKAENEAAAVGAQAVQVPSQAGGIKEALAVESGPAKTRVARRGGYYGGGGRGRSMGIHGGGGFRRFGGGSRSFRGHRQRSRGFSRHSRPSWRNSRY